jgi:hypothetical protein
MTEYQPGVCNIGRVERRRRRVVGAASLVGAVAFVAYALVVARSPSLLVVSFPLWFGAALGFVQDRMGFCVGFGALARYDLSGSGGGTGTVGDAEAVRRDRKRALSVLAVSLAVALAATAVVWFVGTALL